MRRVLDAEPIVFHRTVPENPWPKRIEKAAGAVFGGLLGGPVAPASASTIRFGDVTAVINFTGLISGLLSVCCCFAAAKNIASHMLGIPQPADEQIEFSLGELAHRIARKLRSETKGIGYECQLSSPMIANLESTECGPLDETYLIVFDFQGFPIWIRLSLCV